MRHLALLFILAVIGCDGGERKSPRVEAKPSNLVVSHGRIESQSLNAATASPVGPLFERLTAEATGIDFVHRWQLLNENDVFETSLPFGCVAIGDYDDDGQPDVYLGRPLGGGRLYRNLGDFRFEDVTETAAVNTEGVTVEGATFADIDDDGDLDLYVCAREMPNRLFVNQGDGSFIEQARAFGLDFNGASIMMAFADYDRDGDLDGYLVTNELTRDIGAVLFEYVMRDGKAAVPEEALELADVIYRPDGRMVPINAGQYDHLYRNNGDGTFTDVSQEAGIAGNHKGLAATWWDHNADGWPDLYVANDYWGPDHLYQNNGDGTFTDRATGALPHTPWLSMGADVGDLNNDGRLDFMASDMMGIGHYRKKIGMGDMSARAWFLEVSEPRQYFRNAVYLNTGTERFLEAAQMAGLDSTDWTWSIKLADLDLDGKLDVYVTN